MVRRTFIPLFTIVLLLGVIAFSIFLSSSPISWDDGLRHLAMARVMVAEGFVQSWDRWLFGGYLSVHPVDPWFLANVSYIPFIGFADPIALRLYSIFGIAALLLALLWVIRREQLPPMWTAMLLLTVCIAQALYGRLLLGRPFVWGTIFSLLALDAVLHRQWRTLGVILFIATLFSQLFIFPLALAVVGVVWLLTLRETQNAIFAGAAAVGGTAAGILLHPYPFAYVAYIVTVFLRIPFSGQAVTLGTEMESGVFGASAPAALIGAALLFAVGARATGQRSSWRDLHRDGTTLLVAIVVVLLLAYLAAWSRVIDLLWPLGIVLLARVMRITALFAQSLFTVSMKPLLPRVTGGALVVGCLIVAFLTTVFHVAEVLVLTDEERSLKHMEPLAALPAGSRVLNPEWFHFPVHVAVNPRLKFAAGIDNTFTWMTDREGYQLLEVTFSQAAQAPQAVVDTRKWITQLVEHFPSDYLVLSSGWGANLLPLLRETPGLTELTQSGARVEVFAIGEELREGAELRK